MTCEKCTDWKECPGFEHYELSDIKPCPLQVKWILENYEDIDKGIWPAKLSSMGNRSGVGTAPFVKPAEIAMMVWQRIQKVQIYSDDGELAINVLMNKWDVTALARIMKIPTERLEARINRVLRYCAGKNTKTKNYKEWCQHRKYRAKPSQTSKMR